MYDLDYTVAIPTKDRPAELKICCEHLIKQKYMPKQIIVLDDGNLDEKELRLWLKEHADKLLYHKKQVKGLVSSLNKAVELCTTKWLMTLDDDLYLDEKFTDVLVDFFIDRQKRNIPEPSVIAGSAERMYKLATTMRGKLKRFCEQIFLINGWCEGRFLPSSFCSDYDYGSHPDIPYSVEHVAGCLGLWKMEILRQYSFDSTLKGYAHGNDKFLAYQISRKHEIVCIPKAKGIHAKSPSSRMNAYNLGIMRVEYQYRFYRDKFEKKPYSFLFFYYALIGQIVTSFIGAVLSSDVKDRFQETKGLTRGLINTFTMK